jgi:hypothetical protein
MPSLSTTVERGVRAIAEKLGDLRKPTRDAAAITAQMARHRLDQAEGAAVTFGRVARRRSGEIARQTAARAGRSPILTGALLLAVVTGGLLLLSGRARSALRTGAKNLGDGLRGAGMTGTPKPLSGRANLEPLARARQEALLDEGIEETFPASDPVSVKRIT